jgi:1,4-dihydroxy-2-naphthoate octaprenyltransferase
MAPHILTNPWLIASRPKTLFAGIAPVLVGAGIAFYDGEFAFWPAFAALLGAVFIQIGANFANDLADFQRGADTDERLGPVRVTQAGLLTPRQVQAGMLVSFGLASLVGIYLIEVAGWPVILIGVISILAGIAYTGGPLPLGYYGLGDLMVFVFFGPAAVVGTYFV